MSRSQGRKKKIRALMQAKGISYSRAAYEYDRRRSTKACAPSLPVGTHEKRGASLAMPPAMRKVAEAMARDRKRMADRAASPAMRKLAEDAERHRKRMADLAASPAMRKLARNLTSVDYER